MSATDFDRLEHRLELLADHLGVNLDALEAVEAHNRRGPLVDWAQQIAAGIDPTTGELLADGGP